MWKVLKRQWKYLTAKLSGNLEERADPKVQLEQAIGEAQEQHRRLVEQAANVIARQKQTEIRLHRAMDELEKTNSSAKQALILAKQAQDAGDSTKAAEYNQTAEAFANRLIASEKQIEDLKQESLQTTAASQQAKAAVQQNSMALQERLAERQKLLSQLDQAKMQEQLNSAMGELSKTVDSDVPSLDQVREKIEARYAKAVGTSELTGNTVESRMLEVQQATMGNAARSRLDDLRAEMGLTSGSSDAVGPGQPASGELGEGTASASTSTESPAEPAAQPAPQDDNAG